MRENWEALVKAIIMKAVNDYRKARKQLREEPDNEKLLNTIHEVERFFRSKWFRKLSGVDGRMILYNLRREAA